jgi:CheY-like chemotaxis protein
MKTLLFEQFVTELADAYEHLYDLVYLRTHSLLAYLLGEGKETTKEKAWQFHHTLLNAIQELDPGPQVPTFSREWRRHRLMILRYVDGLTPQTVADQLAISRRHYYREHDGAIDALAHILWRRVTTTPAAPLEAEAPAPVDRMELLRLEAAHLAQIDRRTALPELLEGVFALLKDQAQQKSLTIQNGLSESIPAVWSDRRILRQLLLGLVGYLIGGHRDGTLDILADVTDGWLVLTIQANAGLSDESALNGAGLSDFEALATLSTAKLEAVTHGIGISLRLYTAQRTVLIVDDNRDILELFDRYLKPHDYAVITVDLPGEVLSRARSVRPTAIVLDLMMPDQDGWDLMQTLQNHPETRTIPIVVCSVLRQRELALSLGATAFLEKPISEDRVLSVLDLISNRVP